VAVYGIIPARSGSKSLPDKNISLLMGHPLLSYSISTALQCNFIDKVFVSSDSQKILDIAADYGAEVILRPLEISGDVSRDVEFLKHFKFVVKDVVESDSIVLLRPTHPLRNIEILKKAFELYAKSKNIDSLRSMKKSKELVFKTWSINSEGFAIPVVKDLPLISDAINAPRQILPSTFYQDGYIDIFPLRTVFKFNSTSGEKVIPFLIEDFSVDIDTSEDMNEIFSYLNSDQLPKWFSYPSKKI
jgi:CMP-N,N'-diacetyllegionaminic acid synthase